MNSPRKVFDRRRKTMRRRMRIWKRSMPDFMEALEAARPQYGRLLLS